MDATPVQTIDHNQATTTGRERGQAMVEFAMVLPILVTILFATIQFGMAFWNYQQVSAAASEGARRASISRNDTNRTATVRNAVIAASPKLSSSSIIVTTNSSWTAGQPVTVTVAYPQKITILGATLFNKNLTVSRTSRVEQ